MEVLLLLGAPLDELDICNNTVLTGSSLELLPRCCPGQKNLRLTKLPRLRGGFLSALQHLTVCCMLHATLTETLQSEHTPW